MQQPLLDVDVQGVLRAGTEVRATGADVRAAVTEAADRLAPPGQPGSDAATAARTAAPTWQAALRRLADDLEAFADILAQAAQRITSTDQSGADSLREAPGQGAPPPGFDSMPLPPGLGGSGSGGAEPLPPSTGGSGLDDAEPLPPSTGGPGLDDATPLNDPSGPDGASGRAF